MKVLFWALMAYWLKHLLSRALGSIKMLIHICWNFCSAILSPMIYLNSIFLTLFWQVDSLDSERKSLMQRIADLTEQLDTAQKTTSSLENINVSATRRQIQQTDVFCFLHKLVNSPLNGLYSMHNIIHMINLWYFIVV